MWLILNDGPAAPNYEKKFSNNGGNVLSRSLNSYFIPVVNKANETIRNLKKYGKSRPLLWKGPYTSPNYCRKNLIPT